MQWPSAADAGMCCVLCRAVACTAVAAGGAAVGLLCQQGASASGLPGLCCVSAQLMGGPGAVHKEKNIW